MMEAPNVQSKVSIHPASQTSEGVARLAASIEPRLLYDDRLSLLGSTKAQFEVLRRECMELGQIMNIHDPESVKKMIDGFDVFVENFVKLVERVGADLTNTPEKPDPDSQSSLY